MSLIEVNADVKLLVRALDRIASGIETLLLHAYGIDMAAPHAERAPEGEAAVTYANDHTTLVQEAEAELERKGYRMPKGGDAE